MGALNTLSFELSSSIFILFSTDTDLSLRPRVRIDETKKQDQEGISGFHCLLLSFKLLEWIVGRGGLEPPCARHFCGYTGTWGFCECPAPPRPLKNCDDRTLADSPAGVKMAAICKLAVTGSCFSPDPDRTLGLQIPVS